MTLLNEGRIIEVAAEHGADDGVMDIATRAYLKKCGVVMREMGRIGAKRQGDR